jgi:integrase
MKSRFRLIRRGTRGGKFYCVDTQTGKRTSLQTANEDEARQLVECRNQAIREPAMNEQKAQIYLQHSDPALANRTWQHVMEQMLSIREGENQARWDRAIREKPFDFLRHRKLTNTNGEHFLATMKAGSVSTNHYLRRIHNFALDMNWLLKPVLPKARWPKPEHREKRAITREEHQKIIAREHNPATLAYYELLWHLGGAQSDVANLKAENIDWKDRTIAYCRKKTDVMSLISFGDDVAAILKTLPQTGQLFPALARIPYNHRAKMFIKRLATVGVSGVSLHSYRYAWAERAVAAGYPERYAMQALGHSSDAVHRAYAKKAQVVVPPLESYEKRAAKPATQPPLVAMAPDASRN